MPPRTAKLTARDSLDVWQIIRRAQRSSHFRQTQPGGATHARTPAAPRGAREGGGAGSGGDGLGGDVDGALPRRAVLVDDVVVAPGCGVLLRRARRDGRPASPEASPRWPVPREGPGPIEPSRPECLGLPSASAELRPPGPVSAAAGSPLGRPRPVRAAAAARPRAWGKGRGRGRRALGRARRGREGRGVVSCVRSESPAAAADPPLPHPHARADGDGGDARGAGRRRRGRRRGCARAA